MKKRKEIFLFSLIFVLGAFLRLYKINQIPPGLHGDEAQSGLEALKILSGAPYQPYSADVYGQTTFYFYLVAAAFKLLGPSPVAIRMTSVFLGIFTLPLFYLFVKEGFNKTTALFATFFLAVSRWHLHLSRLGLMSVMMTLFQAGLFLFFFKGLRTKQNRYFALAGLFLSLGLNSYMAFRFVPLVILGTIFFLFLAERKIIKENYPGLLVFFLIAILLSLPLLLYASQNWALFNGRMRSIWVFHQQPSSQVFPLLWQNLKGTLLSFHFRGSTWPHKNLPGASLLDPISGLFFLLGFAVALLKIKKPIHLLILINLVTMAAISVFSQATYPPAVDPIRSSGVIISAIALAGVGTNFIWQKAKKVRWLLLVFLPATLIINSHAYFLEFAHHPAVWHDFHFVPCEVAKFANQNPRAYLYLLSDWFYIDYLSIKFLAPDLKGEDFSEQLGYYSPKSLPAREKLKEEVLFVILPFYESFLSELKSTYPQGEIKKYFGGPEKKLIFTTFSVHSPPR